MLSHPLAVATVLAVLPGVSGCGGDTEAQPPTWPDAAAYEAELTRTLGPSGRIDYVLLGVGTDGHVASLFPDHPMKAEVEQRRLLGRDRLAEKAYRNGRLYLKLRHWNPALYYFRDVVRKDFPESRWADRALAGEAAALHGLGHSDEARSLLELGTGKLSDPEARRMAEDLRRKLGAARPDLPVPGIPAPDSSG